MEQTSLRKKKASPRHGGVQTKVLRKVRADLTLIWAAGHFSVGTLEGLQMRQYSSNQDFYDHIDDVVELLRLNGHQKPAEKIHNLIYMVLWTTSSELFGELRKEFSELIKGNADLPRNTRDTLKDFVKTIDKVWN